MMPLSILWIDMLRLSKGGIDGFYFNKKDSNMSFVSAAAGCLERIEILNLPEAKKYGFSDHDMQLEVDALNRAILYITNTIEDHKNFLKHKKQAEIIMAIRIEFTKEEQLSIVKQLGEYLSDEDLNRD